MDVNLLICDPRKWSWVGQKEEGSAEDQDMEKGIEMEADFDGSLHDLPQQPEVFPSLILYHLHPRFRVLSIPLSVFLSSYSFYYYYY